MMHQNNSPETHMHLSRVSYAEKGVPVLGVVADSDRISDGRLFIGSKLILVQRDTHKKRSFDCGSEVLLSLHFEGT